MHWNDSETQVRERVEAQVEWERWEFWAHVGEVLQRPLTRAQLDAAARDPDVAGTAARLFPWMSAEEHSELLWAAGEFARMHRHVDDALCA